LGDAGFAQFTQVQATIPDRLLVDAVNQQGGNLSEGQSQQLLQILTEVRRQIVGQSDITQNLGSMSPGGRNCDHATAASSATANHQ
jgi:hypothetical protein